MLGPRDGMTIVEMVVALAVAAVILTAGSAALVGAMSGLNYSRENRQAADLLTEVIEGARSGDYAGVAVAADATALAGDDRLTSSGGGWLFDPDGDGPAASERLVVASTGQLPLAQTLVRDGTPYRVSTYVTEPAGADADYRRVVTLVSWDRNQATHERRGATFVTATRRGLPLPKLNVNTPEQTIPVGPTATLFLPLSVSNRGYRDRWDIAASTPGRDWTVEWYLDENADGQRNPGEDTQIADTSGNGIVDTGFLQTDETLTLVGVVAMADDTPGSTAVTISARSVSQPDVPPETLTHTVEVVPPGCDGCTYRGFFLHNQTAAPADSELVSPMPLADAAGAAVSPPPDYDLTAGPGPGRDLVAGGTPTSVDLRRVAIWDRQFATATTLRGDAVLSLPVAMAAGVDPGSGVVTAHIGYTNNNGGNWTPLAGASTVPLSFSASFATVVVTVPIDEVTLSKNNRLQVRVTSPSASGRLALAYGTAEHAANIQIPVAT